MRPYWVLAGMMCFITLASGCGPSVGEQMRQQTEKSAMAVDVPKSMTNAEDAPDIKNDASTVVSVTNGDYYVGRNEYPIDALEDKLHHILIEAPNAPIYLQANHFDGYDNVVRVLDAIRRSGGANVALLVRSDDKGPMRRLTVVIPPEPKENDRIKPDPLFLEISLGADGKLRLNKDEKGNIDDTGVLVNLLKEIFKQREASSTSDRSITIRAVKSGHYGNVARLVDAVKGAGAGPIMLAIDDLLDDDVKKK